MRYRYSFAGLILSISVFCSCEKTVKPTVVEDVRVTTAEVTMSDISASRVYSGTVEESSGTSISFAAAGTITTLNVSEGDRVVKGQLIGTIDKSSLQSAYEISKATLDNAQDAYNRLKMLHDSNSIPEMQWVEVQNALRQAQGAERIAYKALSDANLYAPVSGYVSEKTADVGMNTLPSVPVLKIVNINPVKVKISIPENEISNFKVGQTARVVLKSENKTYEGKVTERGVQANPLTRSYDVKIQVANPAGELLPGMICDVTVDSDGQYSAIVLPNAAVLLDADNRNFVWLDSANVAVKRIVSVDGMTDNGVIVTSGVAVGDKVIVSGQQKVSIGTKVVDIK